MQGEHISAITTGRPGRLRRTVPVVVAVAAVLAVLAPMFRSPAVDGFPLSTYPMFARDRGDSGWVDTVVGRDPAGEMVRLSPELIAGSDEPVLASATVARALVTGTTGSLCEQVAARIAEGGRDDVGEVEVVSERHDLDRFEPEDPVERRVHRRCAVVR